MQLNKKTSKPYLPSNFLEDPKAWEIFCLVINSAIYCSNNLKTWLKTDESFIEISSKKTKNFLEILEQLNEQLIFLADKMTRILVSALVESFKLRAFETLERFHMLPKKEEIVKSEETNEEEVNKRNINSDSEDSEETDDEDDDDDEISNFRRKKKAVPVPVTPVKRAFATEKETPEKIQFKKVVAQNLISDFQNTEDCVSLIHAILEDWRFSVLVRQFLKEISDFVELPQEVKKMIFGKVKGIVVDHAFFSSNPKIGDSKKSPLEG